MKNPTGISLTRFFSLSIFRRLLPALILLVIIPFVVFGQQKKEPKEKQWNKITICHSGETIEISENALQAHLNHGDAVGPCKDPQDYEGTVTPYYESTGKIEELIGSDLTALNEAFEENGSAASDEIFVISENSQVLIEIVAERGKKQDVITFLISTYGISEFLDNGLSELIVTVLFPINKLTDLNLRDDIIRFVRPVYQGLTNSGVVTSLGDFAQRSDNARNAFGVDGTGIKIGVLSDSYNLKGFAETDVKNGDLPGPANPDGNTLEVDVLKDYPASNIGSSFSYSDEGRAMLQIIHDVAPKAELAFRTGVVSPDDMKAGILELYAAGCYIIVDDITFIREPFFADGVVAQTVDMVASQGIQYFTSAGNFGKNSYEAQFNPGKVDATTHDFIYNNNEVDSLQNITMGIGFFRIVLQWDDDYYSLPGALNDGAQNDLDIYIISDTGDTLVNNNINNTGGDPIEVMTFKVGGDFAASNIAIHRASGTDNVNFKYVVFESKDFGFEEYTAGSSTITGHANTDGAMTVGAVLYSNTPAFGVDPPTIASFSSLGGLAVNGSDRKKPDFVAPNGVNTTVDLIGFGIDLDIFPNFFGTSASAPHAAGVAALLLQAQSKFGVSFELRQLLQQTAIDMEAPGFDNASGDGFIQADRALLTFATPKPTINALIVPEGATPGVAPFELTIKGQNLHESSLVLLNGITLPENNTTVINSSQLVVEIPEFIGDPPIQVTTASITLTGEDGGTSEPLYLFRAPKKLVKVKADYKTKKYGEMLPVFTASIMVDNIPLSESGLTVFDLGLEDLTFVSPATSLSSVGVYIIRPVDATGELPASFHELYNYNFIDSTMVIEKIMLKISPHDLTKVYGEQISGITFNYEYDMTNIDPDDNEILLDNLMQSHQSTFIGIDSIAVLDRGKGIVNRGKGIVNGTGWLITPNTLINRGKGIVNGNFFIEISDELLEDYELDPANTLTNRGKGIVNGGSLAEGSATMNRGKGIVNDDGTITVDRGKGIVNDGVLLNSDGGFEGFDDLIVIVDTTDYSISSLFSINLISGLEVTTEETLHYIVPGGYFAQESENFEITYGLGDLRILPATLNVNVDDKLMFLEDVVMPKFTSNYAGFQYEDNEDNVFSSITYMPNEVIDIGEFQIIPTNFNFIDEINYTIADPVPGILTVRHLTNGRIAVATANDLGFYDLTLINSDGSNPITIVSVPGIVPGSVSDPDFSPDGMEIVFTSSDGESFTNLWKINSDGSGLTHLTADGFSGHADFSPDGSQIAFIQDGDIAVMNADGSYPGIIADTPENEWGPFYSRDGEEIYFTRSTEEGTNEIFKINLDPARSNLASWWPGDGNVNDIAGGNHGFLQGGPTFGPGWIRQAFQLDGIDDFVMVPDSPDLDFGTKNFTIDLWVNFVSTDGEQVIIEKWVQKFEEASTGWTLTKLDGNVLRLAMRDGIAPEIILDVIPPSIPINTWNHIAVTREGDTFTLYWNGGALGFTDCSYNLNSISSLKMGHRGNPDDTPGSEGWQDFYFNGSIDEVKIYDRALSALEIQEMVEEVETQITSDNIFYRQPDFFRDGSKILGTRADNSGLDSYDIITMDPSGNSLTSIYTGTVGSATASPDGEKIAFIMDDGGNKNLYEMDENGGGAPIPQQLYTQEGLAILQPNWGTYPDVVYIPDEVFEQALINLGFDSDGIINHQILKTDALRIDDLYVEHSAGSEKISDLTGIEAFSNMWRLECQFNELTSLDVSQNTSLTHLLCGGNQLTELDVSKNTNLIVLSCYENLLTSLDLTKNTALTHLICPENSITSLDVTQNTALESLRCAGNELTSLDVSQNTLLWQLVCEGNHLTSLDLSQNTLLTEIDCRFNSLVNLDVRNGNNSNITSFKAITNDLTCISVDDEIADHSSWVVDAGVIFSNDCRLVINGRIAIAPFNDNGDTDLVLVNSDGSNPVTLVSGPEFVRDPQFSPDGEQIVFSLQTENGVISTLWKINSDGTGITQLTEVGRYGGAYFSPDGTKIAYNDLNEIFLMNADGTNPVSLFLSERNVLWPFYSPDGNEIYYTQTVPGGYNEIWKVNIQDQTYTQVTSGESTFYRSPEFLKDGSKIIYTRAGQSGFEGNAIMSMNPDGTDKTVIHAGTTVSHASVSPDNTKLAFIKLDGDVDLYVMNVDGTNVAEIYSRGDLNTLQPSWGPNSDVIPPPPITADIWMLSNADPDYSNPPFDDYLIAYDNTSSEFILEQTGYNSSQSISGIRSISVSEQGDYAWVTEIVSNQLTKVSANGDRLETAGLGNIFGAIDMVSDERVYALGFSGTIHGDGAYVLDANGDNLNSTSYGGWDIVVDENNSGVWIVGGDIDRLDMNLNIQFTIDPIAWSATSVDVDGQGNAWIGVGSLGDEGDQLLMVSPIGGEILDIIPSLYGRPYTVRVNKVDGKVWYVDRTWLIYYDPNDQSHAAVGTGGYSMDIDYHNSLICTHSEGELYKYSFDGDLIESIPNSNIINQNYMAARSYYGDYELLPLQQALADGSITHGDITVYPNPVRDYLEVVHANVSVPVADMSVVVYDESSAVQQPVSWAESLVNHGLEVDMTSLQPGMYIIHVNDLRVVEVFRILKE